MRAIFVSMPADFGAGIYPKVEYVT